MFSPYGETRSGTLSRLRVSTRHDWRVRDAKLVRAHHRQIWPEIRDALEPEVYETALRRSLDSLADLGYGMDETSVMFGVSRQRMQQWCKRYGLSERFKAVGLGSKPRIWDDLHNRFIPLSGDEFHRRLVSSREQIRRRRQQDHRMYLMVMLWTLAQDLGRSPTLSEVTTGIGAWQARAICFRGRPRDILPIPWPSLVRRWYRLVGLSVRPVGRPGWT